MLPVGSTIAARMVFRVEYRTLKMLPRVGKSRSMGVGVMMRHKDRVLAVRHSYRPGYDFPGGGVGRKETALEAGIRELPRRMQEAVRLRYAGGMTIKEIAEIQKSSVGTIKATLHQATRKLQSRLGNL